MKIPRRGILAAAMSLALAAGACASTRDRRADLPAGLSGIGELPPPASAWPAAGFDARHSSATGATGPQTAHVRWARELDGNVTPGPVIGADGTVIVATNAGVLHSLDPHSGADVWTFDGMGGYGVDLSTSAAVLRGGTILWPGPNDTLFALSSRGTLLWTERFAGQVLSPAVAGRNRVYVADLAGHLTALEATGATHRKLWTLDVHGTAYASATVGPDGTVYTAAGNDLVAVRDLGNTGAQLWRYRAKKIVEVSNAVAPDGTVVLGTNHDREYGIRPDGNKA
ncbi:MAG: PQQ-binding-like beta-propeller repeat protein, partial [Pseudonocardiales bacterium]